MLNVAGWISTFSIIPAIMAALFVYKNNAAFKPFYFLIFISGFVEIFNLITSNYDISNLWLINIYALFQYFLIIYQLNTWGLFKGNKLARNLTSFIIAIIWIYEAVSNHLFRAMNEYSLIFSCFFIVIFITVFINRLIFEKIAFLPTEPRFVISVGLLIYFSTTLLIFIFGLPQFDISKLLFQKIWSIHNIINTFTNLIYAAGLLCIRKK